jgi:hypothetical protein
MFIQRVLIIYCLLFITFVSYSYSKEPKYVYEYKEVDYEEKYLGIIEVGATTLSLLEFYIGEGYKIESDNGKTIYYVDTKNNRTLIVYTNQSNVIEKIIYRNKAELPPGIKTLNEIKMSKKLNIKNLFTSTGSRLGYSYQRIVSAYGKPTKEIVYDNERVLKYIKKGKPTSNIVYLEYSFRIIKNKTFEISIENSR